MGVRIADRMVHRRHGATLMCGRYASFLPAEAVARLFHTVNPLPNFPANVEHGADPGRDGRSPPSRDR